MDVDRAITLKKASFVPIRPTEAYRFAIPGREGECRTPMPKNLVLRSIEILDGGRCVDIFERPDSIFGFDEYRRDSENSRG